MKSGGWLHGRVIDLSLGCGLAYAALFVLMAATGDALEQAIPLHVAPLLALGMPHYGATFGGNGDASSESPEMSRSRGKARGERTKFVLACTE